MLRGSTSSQSGMEVGEEGGHLLVGEPDRKRGHHSLPGKDHALHFGISGRSSARQRGAGKDAMEIGRNFLQVQVVVFMAVGAADLVKVLPFCLLRCKGGPGVAAWQSESRKEKRRSCENDGSCSKPPDRYSLHELRNRKSSGDEACIFPMACLRLCIFYSPLDKYSGFMELPSLAQIHDAQPVVYRYMPATPQYTWPLLNSRLGTEAWIKHENHTPVGAFKLRGALVYLDWMRRTGAGLRGVVAATRGNFGQGVGMAARLLGLKAVIVVPLGNSKEKNSAMLSQGVELVEHGQDFQDSLEFARTLAKERGFAMTDSFHERLVMGTATYALEFFNGTPPLDTVYVPIGLGSSICGVAAARNALGRSSEIVGVVAAQSPAYALSFRQRKVVEAPARTKVADGLACRVPNAQAMEAIWGNVARVVEVSEAEIMEAMLVYYQDTHNLAEGAAAAALAAALREKESLQGKRVGIVQTGGNVDRETYAAVLAPEAEPARNG